MLGIEDDDDIDIFSKDESLMNYYQEQNGPEHETIYQFYTRSYQKLCNRIVAPDRFQYDSKTDLPFQGYKYDEYDVYGRGRTLHMCHWSPIEEIPRPVPASTESAAVSDLQEEDTDSYSHKDLPEPPQEHVPPTPICIVYFHTNMRSLLDAKEVLPIAKELSAHIVSFDLPGCGKSEGQLGGNLDLDMEIILDWVQALIDPGVQIIIWARGMSTAPTVTLLRRLCIAQHQQTQLQDTQQENLYVSSSGSSSKKKNNHKTLQDYHIIATILDSPFTSIEDMVQHGLEQFQGRGFSLTKTLLSFLIHRTLAHISKQLQGFNLFSVRPIDEVGDVHCPVCILSASCDDYVPVQQGQAIAAGWAQRVSPAYYPPVITSVPSSAQDDSTVRKNESAVVTYTLQQQRQWFIEYHIFEEVTCKHFDPRPLSVVSLASMFIQKQLFAYNNDKNNYFPSSHVTNPDNPLQDYHSCGNNNNNTKYSTNNTSSLAALISEGASVTDSIVMDMAEFENIANTIDAEVAMRQQQNAHSSNSTHSNNTVTSPATKLSFSSSTSSLRTMTTSLSQSSWWSFSGRFTTSATTATASTATASATENDTETNSSANNGAADATAKEK